MLVAPTGEANNDLICVIIQSAFAWCARQNCDSGKEGKAEEKKYRLPKT